GTERLEHPRHARNSYSGLQGGTVPVAVRGRRFVSAFQKIHEEATRIVGDTDLVVRQDKFTQSFVCSRPEQGEPQLTKSQAVRDRRKNRRRDNRLQSRRAK